MARKITQRQLKMLRKAVKAPSLCLVLVNFVCIVAAISSLVGLLVIEPANKWHTTTFTLSYYEYRYIPSGRFGDVVLNLYTTDNRRYVLNRNEEIICDQLKEGHTYDVVYSSNDAIKGLSDAENEYLNADEMRKANTVERFWLFVVLVSSVVIFLISNSVHIICCTRTAKKMEKKLKNLMNSDLSDRK